MDCWRKLEYPERTHADTGRTCKPHTETPWPRIELGTYLLWGNIANNCMWQNQSGYLPGEVCWLVKYNCKWLDSKHLQQLHPICVPVRGLWHHACRLPGNLNKITTSMMSTVTAVAFQLLQVQMLFNYLHIKPKVKLFHHSYLCYIVRKPPKKWS